VNAQTTPTALTLGTEVNGSIAKPGEQDEYTFTGTVGQGLYLDSLGSLSNLTTQLISPSGTTVFNIPATNDRNPFFLTETGTYRILVDASGAVTGNYSFRLLDLGTI
jgi:hypothetical protein